MSDDGWQRVAAAIKRARLTPENKFMTAAQLAQASGKSASIISRLETGGQSHYDEATLRRVEAALGKPAGWIDAVYNGADPDQWSAAMEQVAHLPGEQQKAILAVVEKELRALRVDPPRNRRHPGVA